MNAADEVMSTQPAGATLRWRLVLARSAWVAISLLAFGVFALSIPPYYAQTRAFVAPHQYAPEAVRAGLAQLGIPIEFYFAYTIVLVILIPIVFCTAGL